MKRKAFILFLGFEAALCILLSLFQETLPKAFISVMAFPFEQTALGLRALSLSGSTGNTIAILLYVAICLGPAIVLYLLSKMRSLYPEDWLLIVLSVVLFPVIYLMINPGMLHDPLLWVAGPDPGKALLGNIIWSVIVGYILLRILRHLSAADTARLHRYMAALLYGLSILFVYLAFGSGFRDLLNSIESLRASNTGNEHTLGISCAFLVLQYIINTLPYVLDILVVFAGLRLLTQLQADRYSEASVGAAHNLSRLCGRALVVIVVSNTGFNLLQFIFMKNLRVVNSVVQIPILSIAFLLAALLLSQYIRENKQLKDDNDMFI